MTRIAGCSQFGPSDDLKMCGRDDELVTLSARLDSWIDVEFHLHLDDATIPADFGS